jgi:hypothetical protein
MKRRKPIRAAMRWTAAGLGLAGAAYAGYVVLAWQRYGRPKPSRFPLSYDVGLRLVKAEAERRVREATLSTENLPCKL